jgi:uncharacterized protein (TIGR02444 family)
MSGTEQGSPPAGSPFWRFSLRYYRQPGVGEACIALQDGAGIDVNLLLFLLWQASQGRTFSVADVDHLNSQIGPWRRMTVMPLREIRRALRSPPALVEAATAEAFRTRIKAVELEAERLQQEAMYQMARSLTLGRPAASPQDAARDSLAAYEATSAEPFSKPAVETLLAVFARLDQQPEE